MTSGYPPWTGCSANTPPPSSSTASIVVPRKKGDSSRHKQQKFNGRATQDTNGDFDAPPQGLFVRYLPLSPDPTTLSGQSTGQDASTRYGSRSPDQASHFRSAGIPEVVLSSTSRAPKLEPSQASTKSPSLGRKSNAIKTYQKKAIAVKADRDVGHKPHKKTSGQSQRTTPGTQQSRTGVMAAPKAVFRDDLHTTLSQEGRPKKRPRVEGKNSSIGPSSKTVNPTSDGRHSKKSEHHSTKKLKLTHSAATTVVKATSSSTSHKCSTATADVRTVLSKKHKTLITYTKSPQGSKATLHAAGATITEESAPSRFRVKEKIDYRVKLALTLNPPEPKPPGPKSKGKAVRKKINTAAGDVSAQKRVPSPFPAWHRTTSALNTAGVAEVEMKDVEEIPEDDCYVYIPIYEPTTKPTQPELIPDRFDARLNHPALQVKDLLRRAVPSKCGWKGCDAVLACEPMLDKHINKCGHISKALVVHRNYFEPDAWICQWESCGERAFADEDHLNQHVKAVHVGAVLTCPYDDCNEEPAGFPKMSLLGAHVRKSHPSSDPSKCILKPLVGANDNKLKPKRHADPVPIRSQPFKSIYIPVSRPVWRSEPRKKAVIDLVADRSFIDKLDVKMQAGNIEMNAGIISDPEHPDTMSDTELDVDLPEVEEVWKDHEPDCEMPSDLVAQVAAAGPIRGSLSVPLLLNVSVAPSGSTTPAIDMQKRRSNRLKDGEKVLLSEGLVTNSLRDPRDPGYCILIPVTRDWVSLPDGPGSL